MKTIISMFLWIGIFGLTFLIVGGFQISFKPFSISLPYWDRAVALLLIVAALVLYNVGECTRGYKKGLDDGFKMGVDWTIKSLKELQDKEANK